MKYVELERYQLIFSDWAINTNKTLWKFSSVEILTHILSALQYLCIAFMSRVFFQQWYKKPRNSYCIGDIKNQYE